MKKINCTIRFITPAFLGDANGNGAWRVPPFKAELRHWWRVALASQGMDWETIRNHEAALFGNAWRGHEPCKSAIRMRLSKWQQGQLGSAPTIRKIQNGKASVDGGLYSGYGEIAYDKSTKGVKLEHSPAINAGDSAELRIGITTDDDYADTTIQALTLMSRYGTVGGRSRNGWGSFILEGDDTSETSAHQAEINLRKALEADWARGIGVDEVGPLVWCTAAKQSWEAIMHGLAQLRSDLNRSVHSTDERGLLSYPVTKKSVRGWSSNDRIPNSLRFKVVPIGGQFQGLIFHLPCKPKESLASGHPFAQKPNRLLHFWQGIHHQLDHNHNELQRVSA